jgi:predicted RNase H-like HicB family nuclease
MPVGTLKSQEMKYAVIFEKAEHNWAAYVPDLPGCVTTGKTLEETRTLIAEAIAFHVDGLKRRGYAVPEPSSRAEEIEAMAGG